MRFDFDINGLVMLINDSLKKKVGIYSNEKASTYTDQAVRETFFELLGEEKLTWQNFRNYHNEIFTIMENVLKVNLPGAWEDSEFYKQFVEVKRGDLGEENDFYIEDNSILVVSSFSGNHWDTDRQKITGGRGFKFTRQDLFIPMPAVVKIGEDTILVKMGDKENCPPAGKENCPPKRPPCPPRNPCPPPCPPDRRSYEEYE